MSVYPYKDNHPTIDSTVFLAEGAIVTGDVVIGAESTVWYHTVIRGDVDRTIIGKRVNIQDQSMIHQSPGNPVIIEDDVSVGHQAMLHGCTIKKNALIGMKATVLDGAEIGEEAFIGAGALVTPGTKIPPRTLALGSPARVVRELTDEDKRELSRIRDEYVERGKIYKQQQQQRSDES
ncbi:transferase [Bacillaceae bacterium JMAK1]|nr:transferase [Bacillaceae bacterium JMAK1]